MYNIIHANQQDRQWKGTTLQNDPRVYQVYEHEKYKL